MRVVAMGLVLLFAVTGVSCETTLPPGTGLEKRRSLELFSWWTAPGESEALRALISVHQRKYPESRIFNAAIIDGENSQKLLKRRLENRDPPDFYQGNIHDVRTLVKRTPQAAVSLNPLFKQLGLREVMYPELLTDLEIDGQLIAMPVNIHRENTVFYNRAIFDRLHLSVPRSQAELWETCARLKEAGVVPIATSHQGWILRIFFYTFAMGHMGTDAYAQFLRGKLTVADSGIREAISAFARLMREYTNEEASQNGFGWSQAASAVYHGDAAMMFHGDWVKGYFQSLGWIPGKDFYAHGPPGAEDFFLYGMDVFVLPPHTQNKKGATEFLATVAGVKAQAVFNGLKGSSPMRDDVPTDHLDPVARATSEDLRSAKHRVLAGAPLQWGEALEQFARTGDETALYQVFLEYPPGAPPL